MQLHHGPPSFFFKSQRVSCATTKTPLIKRQYCVLIDCRAKQSTLCRTPAPAKHSMHKHVVKSKSEVKKGVGRVTELTRPQQDK